MGVVDTCRFDVFLVSLDPTQGSEIKKTRPCVIISPDVMNRYAKTLIVAPMTRTLSNYVTRIPVIFDEKEGRIILDQIRTIDKSRIVKKLGSLDRKTASCVLDTLGRLFS